MNTKVLNQRLDKMYEMVKEIRRFAVGDHLCTQSEFDSSEDSQCVKMCKLSRLCKLQAEFEALND